MSDNAIMVDVESFNPFKKPKVSSIYDSFSLKSYRNIPVYFLFKYDIGLLEWAIKKVDDFCIKEYDYLPQLCTVNKKMFEMSHMQEETMENFRYYAGFMSGEEMLAAFGKEKYFTKLDVKNENDRKLQKFGIKKAEPRMMDRTYLCYNRSSFPILSAKWIYEKTERSAKNTADIVFFKAYDENASYAQEFKNSRIGVFSLNQFYTILNNKGETIANQNDLVSGDIFEAATNQTSDMTYTFRKIS